MSCLCYYNWLAQLFGSLDCGGERWWLISALQQIIFHFPKSVTPEILTENFTVLGQGMPLCTGLFQLHIKLSPESGCTCVDVIDGSILRWWHAVHKSADLCLYSPPLMSRLFFSILLCVVLSSLCFTASLSPRLDHSNRIQCIWKHFIIIYTFASLHTHEKFQRMS